MIVWHDLRNTLLEGPVRDRVELHGLLQRVLGVGLTLLNVTAIGGFDR